MITDNYIDFPVLTRIKRNGETVGISHTKKRCMKGAGNYFIIPGDINVQNIQYWISTRMQVGLRVCNIMIISSELAKQGQSFCSYEQFFDFPENGKIFFNDNYEVTKMKYKLEVNHIRLLGNSDIPYQSQMRGRIDGRSNLDMERWVSTTPSIKYSILEGARRQTEDFKIAENNFDRMDLNMREDIESRPLVLSEKPMHNFTKSGKTNLQFQDTSLYIIKDKLGHMELRIYNMIYERLHNRLGKWLKTMTVIREFNQQLGLNPNQVRSHITHYEQRDKNKIIPGDTIPGLYIKQKSGYIKRV
jgi:hypothetical protein